jgi:hypothetical protein
LAGAVECVEGDGAVAGSAAAVAHDGAAGNLMRRPSTSRSSPKLSFEIERADAEAKTTRFGENTTRLRETGESTGTAPTAPTAGGR